MEIFISIITSFLSFPNKSVNRLQRNPGHNKSRNTLRKAYPMAKSWHLSRIKTLKTSKNALKWEEIARHYNQLNWLTDQIARCPGCLKVISSPTRYTNKVLTQEKLPGEYIWRHQWGYFNGDKRALESKYLEMVENKELPPPPAQNLFVAFTQPIYQQITAKIDTFYRHY